MDLLRLNSPPLRDVIKRNDFPFPDYDIVELIVHIHNFPYALVYFESKSAVDSDF